MVEFTPLHLWNIGDENTIEYTLPPGFVEESSDWIGIYKVQQQISIYQLMPSCNVNLMALFLFSVGKLFGLRCVHQL